jgi:hypothetical protein
MELITINKNNTHLGRDYWEIHCNLADVRQYFEILDWCWDTFGDPNTDSDTGLRSSWDCLNGLIYLYDETYVTLFLLRWQ